jgi:soluble lytic murein transglycosylase-like protein
MPDDERFQSMTRIFGTHAALLRVSFFASLLVLAGASDDEGSRILAPFRALDDARALASAGDVDGTRRALTVVERAMASAGTNERALLEREVATVRLDIERPPDTRLALAQTLASERLTRPRARAVRIDAWRALGREQDAQREERLLLTTDVSSREARALEEALTSETRTLTVDEWRVRLDALVAAGRLARGAREAAHLPFSMSTHDGPILGATVRALVRGGEPERALALLDAIPKDDAARARVLSTAAGRDAVHDLAAWTLGKAFRIDDAVSRYDVLSSTTTDRIRAGDACFLAAFLRYESDAIDDAHARFQRCLDVGKIGEREVALRWYLAFTALLRHDDVVARRELDVLVTRFSRDREVRKHRFFRALLDKKSSLADARARAERELRVLDDENPIDWYGMLARRALQKEPRAGVKVARDALAARPPSDANAARAMTLARAGFLPFARAVVVDRAPADASVPALAAAVGAHHVAWRRSGVVMPRPLVDKQGALRASPGWRASYAAPYAALVDDAATRAQVPSSFVWAIMRTESGFDETALSIAGARGLLQLMPHTARGIAAHSQRTLKDDDALFEPSVIIPLGAETLGLWRRETGSLLLAAAAYNGAPDNVARWVDRHHALDVILFVERIPFKETRDYVKSVLAAEAVYRALDGGPLALELPKSIAPFTAPPTAFTSKDGG